MKLQTLLCTVAAAVAFVSNAIAAPLVGGYILLDPTDGPSKLALLANNAATLPINRLYLSFARPDMVYVPGSHTLSGVGLNYINSGDYGYADLQANIAKLQAGGVQVYLSVGGWDYSCFGYTYAVYSVGGYGAQNPTWYQIAAFGTSTAACNEGNQWCYVCEPQSAGEGPSNYAIWPEPTNSTTWNTAVTYVKSKTTKATPVFHPELVPGSTWTDPKDTTRTVTIPGNNLFATLGRDPYQDLVYLAKDLALDGVDIDYEEMWHADYFRAGPNNLDGPWTNYQTTFKYTAIIRDVMINIQALAPTLKLSTAAAAAGGDSGVWYGGNLKGIWYWMNKWYPDTYKFMSVGGGGVNIMTYDLSDNEQYYECPTTTACTLSQQTAYYLGQYTANGMAAIVGYEIGTPAYPDPAYDPTHQLPLIQSELTTILTASGANGGFFWEMFKPPGDANNVNVTSAAQQICAAALGASTPRCSGVIPAYPPVGGTTTTTVASSTTTTTKPATTTTATTTTTVVVTTTTTTTTTVKPTTTTTTVKPTTTTSASSGNCAGLQTWTASGVYVGGTVVQYQGNKYTAQWWTTNEVPGTTGQWGVWSAPTAC